MARTANLTISRKVGDIPIYQDFDALPDDEAIKKSVTRARNQAQAQKRKAGHTPTPRGKRTGKPSEKAMSKMGLSDSPAAKALHAKHMEAVKAHDDELKLFTESHRARRAELDKAHADRLAAADDLIKMVDLADRLGNAKIKAEAEKLLAAYVA